MAGLLSAGPWSASPPRNPVHMVCASRQEATGFLWFLSLHREE